MDKSLIQDLSFLSQTQKVRTAVIGIGNTLAGDDGAGIAALELLKCKMDKNPDLLFASLYGDLFSVTEFLGLADRFIFLDAVAASVPGELFVGVTVPLSGLSSSFHQSDIGSVMESLRRIEYIDPFPVWEIRGVTIMPPDRLHEGLSPAVEQAVGRLVDNLVAELRERSAGPDDSIS